MKLKKNPLLRSAQKRILLRLDLNVPISKGRIKDDYKIIAALPTIKRFSRQPLVIMTHLGEPVAKKDYQFTKKLSVVPIAQRLEKLLKRPVRVIGGDLAKINTAAQALQAGEILMLENMRFYKGETVNNTVFAKVLASLGDIYINDAFAVSHRKHASVSAVTKYMPAYAGPLLEQEVHQLEKIRTGRRPLVVIFGGAKISGQYGKLKFIRSFEKIADTILVGGDLANDLMSDRHGLSKKKVLLPEATSPRRLKDLDPETIHAYTSIIKEAKTIFWNGPMGIFEQVDYAAGTAAIIKAVAAAKKKGALTMAGGGETAEAIDFFRGRKAFSWISTGGGATLAYLAGEAMPGLEGIKIQ